MNSVPSVKVVLINTNKVALKVRIPGTTRYRYNNLNIEVDVNQWDRKAGQAKKGHKNAEIINNEVFTARRKVIKAFECDIRDSIDITEAIIISRLAGDNYNSRLDFYKFCRDQINVSDYSKETRRTYLSEVSKMELKYPTLSFIDINFAWLQKYENYMRTTLSNHDNTVWKSMKFIRTMINAAIKTGGIIDKSPFAEYKKLKYKQGIPTYLEWREMQLFHKAIKTKPLTEKMRLIGYYSLLSCYTGLRFGDAIKFNYKTKVIQEEHNRRLVLNMGKTGEIVSIAFNKYIDEVVDYIADKPLVTTNQEFNEALKVIAGIAGITKEVSSHTARHSFAMRCAELKMSIDEVQKLLGHNKRASTEIYFKIKGKRLDEAMSRWE